MIRDPELTQGALIPEVPPARRLHGRNGSGKAGARGRGSVREREEWRRMGLISPGKVPKTFLLDTNVLLHDPASVERFAEHHVCIPVDVLSELDRFKNEPSDRGANARSVHRRLTALFAKGGESVTGGVPTAGGGTVRLVAFSPDGGVAAAPELREMVRLFPALDRVDHRILACAVMMSALNTSPVILVTKDLNLQLKAKAIGIRCEDYLSDKVEERDVVSSAELLRVPVSPHDLQRFASSGAISVEGGGSVPDINEYVLLQAGARQTMPARHTGNGTYVRLRVPDAVQVPNGQPVRPLNLGQQCLLDALLNPEISLVTCYGQAGTGKTLLAVAAGLSEVFNRHYNGLTVSRPVVAMGDTLGFLPGTLNEKLRPWLQPVYDALDLLMRPAAIPSGPRRKQEKRRSAALPAAGTAKPYDALIEQGVLEIEALCYIRGRSIPNRFFVLDEAQQLTPLEAKTVVTRMSRGSKLVLTGDPGQIDNPYVDSRSNGLVYTRNRLRGEACTAHVCLTRGERSPLAEAGARLM